MCRRGLCEINLFSQERWRRGGRQRVEIKKQRKTQEKFSKLLNYLEKLNDDKLPVSIKIHGCDQQWLYAVGDLKDVLMGFLAPQAQIAESETLEFQPPKWEYRVLPFFNLPDPPNRFNKLGEDGWELVQCDFKEGDSIFKRPLRESDDKG